jgi:Holliday junction resolvasome RuvABC endonuclease subunit
MEQKKVVIKFDYISRKLTISYPDGKPDIGAEKMYSGVMEIAEKGSDKLWRVNHVVTENQYFGVNPKTLKNLVALRSWFLMVAYIQYGNIDVDYTIFNPSEWQKFYGIKGRVKSVERKKIIKKIIQSLFSENIASEDICDALAMSIYKVATVVGEDEIFGLIKPHLEVK